MKQNITREQLSELSEESTEKLKEWVKHHFENQWVATGITTSIRIHQLPLLNIGQMIEYLFKNRRDKEYFSTEVYITTATFGHFPENGWNVGLVNGNDRIGEGNIKSNPELCDSLWEAVKEVLEAT